MKSNSGKRGNTVEMVGKTGGLPYLPQTGLAFTLGTAFGASLDLTSNSLTKKAEIGTLRAYPPGCYEPRRPYITRLERSM